MKGKTLTLRGISSLALIRVAPRNSELSQILKAKYILVVSKLSLLTQTEKEIYMQAGVVKFKCQSRAEETFPKPGSARMGKLRQNLLEQNRDPCLLVCGDDMASPLYLELLICREGLMQPKLSLNS